MPEYIEREALIDKIVNTPTVPIRQCYKGNFVYADGTASRQNEIIDYINKQPTADVVKVVRCKECAHGQWRWQYGYCIGVTCEYDQDGCKPLNFFCGNGERREE